ncbi:tuberoinfundibular peptide of 39 residues isoform X3 [Thunnus maccoyii]|uniref:tuberoinfundibular peptide of 39 residues isoform X3 n=1 Tax=Thunnus maccoyii TaxID=8240 RepID=UPI001C4D06DB|nr:tuberoinfundibular peptide of 39 residues isoform X3 [Thunnus maccoyii]
MHALSLSTQSVTPGTEDRMSGLPAFPRTSFLLLCILGMTLVTSGFPQPRLPLSPDDSEAKRDDWDVVFPSISLRDWSIQMMSAPSLRAAANSKTGLMREAWLFAPERAEASVERAWPAEWSSQDAGMVKRNMVVADDAAFREKSKLLTSMERQKWLNSYMQKLLVVKSS